MQLFSAQQLDILRAVIDRIIPADEYPGGWEAGVGNYIQRQLTSGDLQHLVQTYREGLDALDAEALVTCGLHFYMVEPSQQDELLALIEQATVATAWPVNPIAFMTLLIEHCMEGYYSDPGNGGNRDGVSWKMIGFEVRG
jgi:hypothetical protein